VPSMFDSLRGASPLSNLMEVKESEAQGRRREAVFEGSVERMREPTNRNRIRGSRGRTSWHESAKSASIKGRGCKSGGCAQKSVKLTSGDLCRVGANACVRVATEEAARLPERGTEVSRGHSRQARPIRLSGTLTRKGRNSQGSHDRRGLSKARTVLSPSGEGKWSSQRIRIS
jgi:hypothetical protein